MIVLNIIYPCKLFLDIVYCLSSFIYFLKSLNHYLSQSLELHITQTIGYNWQTTF